MNTKTSKPTLSKNIATLILGLTAMTIMFLSTCTASHAQTTKDSITYHEKTYPVLVGLKGGKYVMLEDGSKMYVSNMTRVRTSVNVPVDNGDGSATYKGVKYSIHVGSRGGRYIVYKANKIYIPKS